MVSVALDSTPRITVLESARDNGFKTGVLAVCTITDASPAAFLSHSPNRRMHAAIAEQISQSNADLLFGGGRQWFLPAASGGKREDGVNLIEKMKGNGYMYVSNADEFHKLNIATSKKVLGLFAENHMGYAEERILTVAEMTKTAIKFLSKDGKGFFLFVENEGTDDAGHANLSDRVKTEVAELDNAVEEATKFAQRNPETLIIVTSDHETGGYALNGGSLANHSVEGVFTTKGHTASMVPLFATGPGAERFTGIIDNTEVGKILLEFVQARKTH
jgi:alkaline phosphatase